MKKEPKSSEKCSAFMVGAELVSCKTELVITAYTGKMITKSFRQEESSVFVLRW